MTDEVDEPACPRCGAALRAERHRSEDGVTSLWRCACGWSRARTESGSLSRARALEAIARARAEASEPPPPEED